VEQVQREYRILEAAPKGSDVEVPEWTIRCMTGKPTVSENPEHWTNMSLAEYFGLHRVRLQENSANRH
jgi:mannosyltransferase OCH1-like enzyme